MRVAWGFFYFEPRDMSRESLAKAFLAYVQQRFKYLHLR